MRDLCFVAVCLLLTFSGEIAARQTGAGQVVLEAEGDGSPIMLHRGERAVISSQQDLKKSLIDEEDCSDLRGFCSHIKVQDDISVLECVQTFQPGQLEGLNEKCQHKIWNYTRNLLKDESVQAITKKDCKFYQEKFADCHNSVQSHIGRYLACLVDKLEDVNDLGMCRVVLQRLESVAFSDYHFLGGFMEDCGDEVDKHSCGRANVDQEKVSQGQTIACLQEVISKLNPTCKNRVLKISQQQADNLKLDHQFFLACEPEARRFCPDERPGSATGGIFKCLIKHRNSPEMSQRCRMQINRRDKLLAHDYKVSRGLAKACKDDIKDNHCRRAVSEDKHIRLAQILLCLETVAKNGTKIAEECQTEINDHRKMLMTDYRLSPEILSGCSDDIQKYCENHPGEEIIHCLMQHTRAKHHRERVTSQCQRSIEQLIKVSDAGEDWRVDPVLRRACKPVVDVACRDTDGGDARVMSCLMEHMGENVMTPDCENALMIIQYFIARNYKLDPQLYRHCKEDAVNYCHAKKAFDDVFSRQMDPDRGQLILPCLYRMAYNSKKDDKKLKKECVKEVKRVMRQRAISVDLIPEVEDVCLEDLAGFCYDKTGKGAEMQCLQDNLEKLQDTCKEAVSTYTEEEGAHVELNPVIMSVCQEAMKTHCDQILKRGTDEGDMMDCLISHKNDADLRQDLKCRAAIEHFQIISLKSFKFTYKFKEACRPYVNRFCSASNTKNDIVACLSEVMRNDTIRGQRHTIPKECRQQVKAQLYQQRETLTLDPKLANACKKEIVEYCRDAQAPGQALDCLETNSPRLGESCRHAIFMVKRSELGDSATDYTLVNTCKDMTFKYCPNRDPSTLLDCLKKYKDDPLFDQRCHLVVVNRLIERNTDYRFNPSLQLACGNNINKYCSEIVETAKPNEELNGKVINCLKSKFREARLDEKCEQKMIEILQDQALNYKMNPLLQNVCKSEIAILCKPGNEIEEHGIVEECLKNAFLNQKIVSKECKIEVANLISEAKADIHVDPLLQQACITDLLKYCSNVKSGNGRKLQCLQTILQDASKAMDDDCRRKLMRRMEMFRNADTVLALPPENVQQLVSQVITSPSRRFFLVILSAFFGVIFIMGMVLGRITKRHEVIKNK